MAERPSRRPDMMREAARLFTVRGFHGTAMDDIASAVGVTKAALYHHFAAKSDILYEIYGAVIDRIAEKLAQHPADLEPTERLRLTMRDMLRVVAEIPVEVTVYLQEGPILAGCLPHAQAKELQAGEARFSDYVVDTVQAGIDAGTLRPRDPSLTALAVIGMVSWACRWYDPRGRASVDEIAELFYEIAVEGIRLGHPLSEGMTAAPPLTRELPDRAM